MIRSGGREYIPTRFPLLRRPTVRASVEHPGFIIKLPAKAFVEHSSAFLP